MTQREKFKDQWRTLLNQKIFPKEYLWDPSHQTLNQQNSPTKAVGAIACSPQSGKSLNQTSQLYSKIR